MGGIAIAMFELAGEAEKGTGTEARRRTRTSSAVKQRYNTRVYDVISVRVPKEMAVAFRAKCVERGDAQAKIIKRAIEIYLSE